MMQMTGTMDALRPREGLKASASLGPGPHPVP